AADSLLNRTDYAYVEVPQLHKAFIFGGKNNIGTILTTAMRTEDSPATVTTDKLDYHPGEIVMITGTGFAAGETVKLTLVRDRVPTGDGITDTVILNATADVNGSFTNSDYHV